MTSTFRAFLADLEAHAVRSLRGATAEHAEGCSACARRLAAARRQIRLLSSALPVPRRPELAAREFVEGVYERAGAPAEERVGPVLEQALARLSAPVDEPWRRGEVVDSLQRQLAAPLSVPPEARSALWSEVRQSVPRRHKPVRRTWLRRASTLAAALVVSAAVLAGTGLWQPLGKDGTSVEPVFVPMQQGALAAGPYAPVEIVRSAGG